MSAAIDTRLGQTQATVLVLLLLVGGVSTGTTEALGLLAAGFVQKDANTTVLRSEEVVAARTLPRASAQHRRVSARSAERVLSVQDATLPAPRAPDGI